ncbi:MAG: DUF1707 domain-containing protein [Micromonosporaceae bacterium]|nr:DUF1707 domain-containing protein [Micromonosporaceae bacterium]
MTGRSRLRAADTDRQATAERLREAAAEGRLDLDEYDHRLRQAYAATNYADLDRLTFDLPTPPPARPAAGTGRAVPGQVQAAADWVAGLPVGCLVLLVVLLVAIAT